MTRSTAPPLPSRAVDLTILAKATASLTVAELAAIRQQSLERFATPLRPAFLKHSDEQSLAALTAVSRAIDEYGLTDDFGDWAIISSTRYLGRTAFAAVIEKYQVDGPWGVSVQVIPHSAPHSVAGTVSLALHSHGPSIGVGAARGEEPQALLSAATLLRRPQIGGAWILLTGWSGKSSEPASLVCIAAALAVVNARLNGNSLRRSIGRIEIDSGRPDLAADFINRVDTPLMDSLVAADHREIAWQESLAGLRIVLELGASKRTVPQSRALAA
jgi:hypothetical protein